MSNKISRTAFFNQTYITDVKVHFISYQFGTAIPCCRYYPPPVGVVAVYRRFNQRRGYNGTGGQPCVRLIYRPPDSDFNKFGSTFSITGNSFSQINTNLIKGILKIFSLPPPLHNRLTTSETISHNQHHIVGTHIIIDRYHVERNIHRLFQGQPEETDIDGSIGS